LPLYVIRLQVDANSEGSKEISGISGTLRKVYAYFPLNAGGFLFCKFAIGNMIFPTPLEGAEDTITADNIAIELPVEPGYTLAAGEKIILWGKNYDAANPHSVFLWIYLD
jgi:hypothetical protein